VHYVVISLSHKKVDINLREKLSFLEDTQKDILEELVNSNFINEAVFISTCNRVEVVVNTLNKNESIKTIFNLLSAFSKIDKQELEGRAEIFEDEGAVSHIFSVASALESLVVGENQIIGQLKHSFNFAKSGGFCQIKLNRLFNSAFKCAAKVKSITDIGKKPVSVASAAVTLAKDELKDLSNYTALVYGTGEMGILSVKHLLKNGIKKIIVVGRDLNKTKEIIKSIEGNIVAESYSKIDMLINSYSLLFTATGAPHSLITKDLIEKRDFNRYWFDLAIPRDINEDINEENIKIFTVDDLKDIVNKNMSLRQEEASKAYKIVGEHTEEFFNWLNQLSVEPIIKEIRQKAKLCSQKEVNRAISKGYLPQELQGVVSKIVHNAFSSFLHEPTIALKDCVNKVDADTVIEVTKELFKIS